MKIFAIHQPNYLPWLGYFNKLFWSDVFVFLDSVQYSPRSFTSRCTINNKGQEVTLSIPVHRPRGADTTILEATIDTAEFAHKHLESFRHAYGKAPHYGEILELLKPVFSSGQTSLARFNTDLILKVCGYLNLAPQFAHLSELGVTSAKNEMIVDVSDATHAPIYLSGSGAKSYMQGHEHEFLSRDVTLSYQDFGIKEYAPATIKSFIPRCSILDALFHLGPATHDLVADENEVPFSLWTAGRPERSGAAIDFVDLKEDQIAQHAVAFESIPADLPLNRWTRQNLLDPRPGKWDLSVAAYAAGTPVGYAMASFADDSTAHLHQFVLQPEARGRGAGRALLNALAKRARAAGRSHVRLKVHRANRGAIAFYRRCGLAESRRVDRLLVEMTGPLA